MVEAILDSAKVRQRRDVKQKKTDRTLTIYRTPEEGRLLHETALVTGEDVLPGFECRVSDLLP